MPESQGLYMRGERAEPGRLWRQLAVLPVLLVTVVALLAYELERTDGHYNPQAVGVVFVCWLGALMALFGWKSLARGGHGLYVVPIMLVWTLVQCAILYTTPQNSDGRAFDAAGQSLYQWLMALAAGSVVAVWLTHQRPRLQNGMTLLAIAVHGVLGAMVVRMAVNPNIDVWTVEMQASKALLSGINPFGITFADPYNGTSPYFPPGVSVGGRLLFGFVYPPLTLLFCLPGFLLGDTRFATMAAMAVGALLIARARPGTLASLSALMFLFTPRTFFVVHRAWTDPFVVMLTALVVYTALRAPKYLYIAAGLYCCVKQHMFIGAPALLLLLPRPWSWRQVAVFYAKVAAVGLLVTLPLALWDVRAFVNSVLNIREVFRTDSLGVLAHLANTGVVHLSKWTGIGVAAVVACVGVRFAPRTPTGFALLAGVTHFSLYLFSTHAFCNEYYNVIGSLCIALGASELMSTSGNPVPNNEAA